LVPFDVIDYINYVGTPEVPLSQVTCWQTKKPSIGSKVEEPLVNPTSVLCPRTSAVGQKDKSSVATNEINGAGADRNTQSQMFGDHLKDFDEVFLVFEGACMEFNPAVPSVETMPTDLNYEELREQTGLTSAEFIPVEQVLREFLPLFSRSPGLCQDNVHKIETGTSKPIKCHPRPMTPAKRQILENLFKSLVEKDSIEEANGPWPFNPVIVLKPNGKWRLCIDYRPLNAVTEADSYGMMRIDDVLTCLGSAKYISTFDIPDGFHNISIFKPDRCKTAFNTPWGLWCHVGITTSPPHNLIVTI